MLASKRIALVSLAAAVSVGLGVIAAYAFSAPDRPSAESPRATQVVVSAASTTTATTLAPSLAPSPTVRATEPQVDDTEVDDTEVDDTEVDDTEVEHGGHGDDREHEDRGDKHDDGHDEVDDD